MTRSDVYTQVYAALAAIPALQGSAPVSPRVYPQMLPQAVQAFPACVYQEVASVVDGTICGSDEAGDDVRIQIDLYGTSFTDLVSLKSASVAALQAISAFPVRRISDNPLPFESDGRLFRQSFDVMCALSNT
jgi:hypothetical protein